MYHETSCQCFYEHFFKQWLQKWLPLSHIWSAKSTKIFTDWDVCPVYSNMEARPSLKGQQQHHFNEMGWDERKSRVLVECGLGSTMVGLFTVVLLGQLFFLSKDEMKMASIPFSTPILLRIKPNPPNFFNWNCHRDWKNFWKRKPLLMKAK